MPESAAAARIGVLLSGRGSNFLALHAAIARGEVPGAEIVLVASNVPDAVGLAKARELGLPAFACDHRGKTRADHEGAMLEALRGAKVEWVCLAGYMRKLSPLLIGAFPRRILNIHPSLLPAFPGLDAQRQALEYGVRLAGCTVHLVDPGSTRSARRSNMAYALRAVPSTWSMKGSTRGRSSSSGRCRCSRGTRSKP